ncbi:hypothetical protein [Tenacibaculum finnmarkense]|uniref:hypothetical protein n=1 Tax=Tenacibaculum finnmarkense TaxID=2781243 RepID=UPI001EFABFE2|nr:hypothetical protein [Tenacibaculum finnmarkense]MCG8253185.1 hypothetical protein [Tenacibaculum finnmarkense genomovar finnmarkense]MCG8816688.1 hypothetical protein [Tenacibaculum finnmarkense]MCG8821697.1 hypothetical protein [Tenacibaculum finnmarkense]
MKNIKICPHCNKEFESNHARRIYCSDSHRVSAYNKKKGFRVALVAPSDPFESEIINKGLSGVNNNASNLKEPKNQFGSQVGAATLGSLAAELALNVFTKDENKPATKKDLMEVFRILQENQFSLHNQSQKTLINNQKELLKEIKKSKGSVGFNS